VHLSKNKEKIYYSLKQKSKRDENKLFIVEGVKICRELIQTDLFIEELLSTSKNIDIFPDATLISEKQANRISNLKSNSGVFAIVRIPNKKYKINEENIIFCLDNISNPGNLGSIIRTLDWFGYTQVICSDTCVDVYNPKTIMASMASVFRIQTHYLDLYKFINEKKENRTIIGANLDGNSIYNSKIPDNSIIIFGNESRGISQEILSLCHNNIKIPGKGKAESLNLSNSVAIIMAEIFRIKINI